jgi:matrixin/carboxypeptidase family protein
MKKFVLSLAIVGVFLVIGVNNLFAQARMAGKFGEAMVNGRRVIVHVTIAVPPGWDENAVADDAVRGQGARPIRPAEFTLEGLRWGQFFDDSVKNPFVRLNYNSAGQPFEAARISLTTAETTWSSVSQSKFSFDSINTGTTTRCPSLVQQCPGPQTFDHNNDVGWLPISGCCTLGVTWYGTTTNEADTVLNSRFQWTTSSGSGFDLQTVFLHELGHTVGLGHSSVSGSVMEANYGGVRQLLTIDDQRGVTYLYPKDDGSTGAIRGFVRSADGTTVISGANISIAGLPVSATSGADGQYTLSGIPTITPYSITATATGYNSQTVSVAIVPSDNNNFALTVKSGGGGAGPCAPKSPNANNCH